MNKLVKQWLGFNTNEKGVNTPKYTLQVKIDSDTEKQLKANNELVFDINGGLKGRLLAKENCVVVMVRKDIHFYTEENDNDYTKGEINIKLTGENWKLLKQGKSVKQRDTRIEGVEFTISYNTESKQFTYTHNFKNIGLPYYVEDDVCPLSK